MTMTKIIIISCIIAAVCVFQTAEAGLLDLPIGSQRQNGMSDAGNVSGMPDLIEKMNELINYIQNAVMVAVKNFIAEVNSIKAAFYKFVNQLQTSEICIKALNGMKESGNTLASNFTTCMQEGKQSISEPIQKLMVPIRSLMPIVLKAVAKISTCIQMPSIRCVTLPQELSKLVSEALPLINEIVKKVSELEPHVNAMRQCYVTALHSTVRKNNTVMNNMKECVTNAWTHKS